MKRYIFVYIRVCWLALVLCLILISSACDAKLLPWPQSPIEEAESRWQQQGIASYRIEVSVFRSIHHAQSYQITVQDGAVVDQSASCIPAPLEFGKCKVEPFEADAYTVPGLFAKASSMLQESYKTWCKVSFDPTYGFPSQISYNHPDMVDEDWGLSVASFEVLP